MKKHPIILLLAIASLTSCEKSEKKLSDSNLDKYVSEDSTAVSDKSKISANSEKNLEDSDLKKTSEANKTTATDQPISPNIKSLYLGMQISDAYAICESLFKQYMAEIESEPEQSYKIKDKVEFSEIKTISKDNVITINLTEKDWPYGSIGDMDKSGKYFQLNKHGGLISDEGNEYKYTKNLLSLESNSQNKVIRIFISLELIKHLFNSEKIANAEFAQKFINAYSIPRLEPYTIPQTVLGAWRYTDANKFILTIIPAPSQFGGNWGGGDVVLETDSIDSQGDFN